MMGVAHHDGLGEPVLLERLLGRPLRKGTGGRRASQDFLLEIPFSGPPFQGTLSKEPR